jgi:hypothetical protein
MSVSRSEALCLGGIAGSAINGAREMPILDLTVKRRLRWDALGVLHSTILFPDDPVLRVGFEARWRAENKAQIPAGVRLFRKTTHEPAKRFSAEPAIGGQVKKRMLRVERVGTLLWLQAVLGKISPTDATENRTGHAISEVGPLSRSSIKRDLAVFRGVLHWCAAIAHQREIFGGPLLYYPHLGPPSYTLNAALFHFFSLGEQFYEFARDSGCFAATVSFLPERDLWTLPRCLKQLGPRREPSWPNCHLIHAIHPGPAVGEALGEYDATHYRA